MARGQRKHASHEEAEETRRTILRTAQQLFMEYGYRAVSTRQIADICGLTQPALYHYFSDKQALYLAVMQENLAETGAALERIARRNEGVQERLERIVRYLLSNNAQHDSAIMFHDIRHELSSEVQAVLRETFQAQMIAPLASIFGDGLRQGLLRDQRHGGTDAITAAYLLLNMLVRFMPRSSTSSQSAASTNGEQAEIIVHILLYGLALPETTMQGCYNQDINPI